MKKSFFIPFFTFSVLVTNAQEAKLVIPTGHYENIQSVDISPDGKMIATASLDNSVIIWDARTWKQLRTISLSNPVQQVIFSRDGSSIIVAESSDQQGLVSSANFSVWNVNTGTLSNALPFDGAPQCTLSWDGTMLLVPRFNDTKSPASGSIMGIQQKMFTSKTVVWNLTNNTKTEGSFASLPDAQFLFHKNDHYLLTVLGEARRLNVFPLKKSGSTDSPARSYLTSNEITRLTTSPAGTYFATAAPKSMVQLWSIENELPVREYKTKGKNIYQLSFSGDGKTLFALSYTNGEGYYLNAWNSADSMAVLSSHLTEGAKRSISISPKGDYFIIQSKNEANVYDMQGHPLAKLSGHIIPVNSYAFSTTGRFAVAAQRASLPKPKGETEAVKEISTGFFIEIIEKNKGIKLSQAQKDSATKHMEKTWNAKKASAIRVWDLQNGSASAYIADTIQFTSDSISPDKKYKLTTDYKSTGLQFLSSAVPMAMGMNPGLLTGEYAKKMLDTGSLFSKAMKDKKSLMFRQKTPVTLLINNRSKDTVYLIALDSTDWMITASDSYYMSSRNATGLLHYAINNDIISFEQLDLKNNRPDKILEKIGYADTALVNAYRNAYRKRIRMLNIDTTYFRDKYSVPEAYIVNKEEIGYVQGKGTLTLKIHCVESKKKLERFNVWVNLVPVFGTQGINIRGRNKNSFDTSVTITLSQGDNRIETSVLNTAGIESYRSPLSVKYMPQQPKEENVYFIGIGINRFADDTYNLQYCEKDMQDLAKKFKEKYGKRLSSNLLLNEEVTKENVKALRQKLLQCKEDDKVIIAFSGHGLLSTNYDYYLSTFNTQFNQPESNGLPYEELENLLDGIPARKKLLLIDACHSGEVDKEDLKAINNSSDSLKLIKGLKPVGYKQEGHLGLKNSFELMQSLFVNVGKSTGATIISAAAGTQFALERNDLKNGVFTFSILEAMNKYPTLKISELKKIVGERVEQLTNGLQKPTSRNETIAVDWSLW